MTITVFFYFHYLKKSPVFLVAVCVSIALTCLFLWRRFQWPYQNLNYICTIGMHQLCLVAVCGDGTLFCYSSSLYFRLIRYSHGRLYRWELPWAPMHWVHMEKDKSLGSCEHPVNRLFHYRLDPPPHTHTPLQNHFAQQFLIYCR